MGRVFRSKHIKLKIAIFMYIKIPPTHPPKKNRGIYVPLVGKTFDISNSTNRFTILVISKNRYKGMLWNKVCILQTFHLCSLQKYEML
jgi:hypothetical protein